MKIDNIYLVLIILIISVYFVGGYFIGDFYGSNQRQMCEMEIKGSADLNLSYFNLDEQFFDIQISGLSVKAPCDSSIIDNMGRLGR